MKPLQKILKKTFTKSLLKNSRLNFSILKKLEQPLINEIPIKTIEG